MRTTPRTRFHYDELVERGPRIEKLIGQAVSQDESRGTSNDEED
jgi:ribosome-binding factor A